MWTYLLGALNQHPAVLQLLFSTRDHFIHFSECSPDPVFIKEPELPPEVQSSGWAEVNV